MNISKLKPDIKSLFSVKGIRGAALLLAIFFLNTGTDLFCMIHMAGKKTFLTASEVSSRSTVSIVLAFLFFFAFFFLLSPDSVSIPKRLLYVCITFSPLLFIAALFNFLIDRNSLMSIPETVSTSGFLAVKIILLILFIAFLILVYMAVAVVSTGGEVGMLRAFLMLFRHFPFALLWFLVAIAIDAFLILTDLAYFTGLIGSTGVFFAVMGWRLLETAIVSVILWFLIESMKNRTNKWMRMREDQKEHKSILMYIPLILLIPAVILALLSGQPQPEDYREPLLAEIDMLFLKATSELEQDELATAVNTMQAAQDRIDAWKAYADEDANRIREILDKRQGDPVIWQIYIKTSDDGVDRLENYVMTEGLSDRAAKAVLLESYAGLNSKKLTKVRKDYQAELVSYFMAEEDFVSGLPELPKGKEAKKLAETLEEHYGVVDAYLGMISVLDDAGRSGEVGTNMMTKAMDIAEKNEEDVILQYLAASIVAAGAADGRDYYYDRALKILEGFLELSENDKKISEEELKQRQMAAIRLMTTLQGYEEIIALIDEMDLDEDEAESLEALRLYCLLNSGSSEDVYEAAAEMVEEGTSEPQIWYYYGVGALQQGDTDAMIEAMESILEMVMDEDLEDRELLRAEQALFIMVEYAGMSEQGALPGSNFYREMSERDQKKLSPILSSYVEAMSSYYNGGTNISSADYPDMDRYEYAKMRIDEVLDERDDLCFAWYLKGNICYGAKQFDEAIECYQEALSHDPENIPFLYALANAYDGAEDYASAYAVSCQVEKLWPKKNHAEDPFGIGFHNPSLKSRLEPYVNGGDE